MPQYYRCVPQQTFSNDWIHFQFEIGEEEKLFHMGIPFAKPVALPHIEFFSFCIRAIADENSASHLHSRDSIQHYFWLLLNKVSEIIREEPQPMHGTVYEMLLHYLQCSSIIFIRRLLPSST